MNEPTFYLSNSKLHDWETMCPIEWKAKHIDKTIEWGESQQMRWGIFFETLVIGSGIAGKSIELGYTELNSVFYPRVKAQAAKARKYLKILGGKIHERQEHIQAILTFDGQNIPIEGTLDVNYRIPPSRRIVIDLKLTGDTENEFGKFAWGAPEKMDLSQIIHYTTLHKLKYGGDFPEAQYWVFDNGKEMKEKLITVDISDEARYFHFQRLSDVYNQINMCIELDDWSPNNSYENCSNCKAKCVYERIMPEFYNVNL
jgi:hypothetical protein